VTANDALATLAITRRPSRSSRFGLVFHTVPTMGYAAKSARQQLVALMHKLPANFQIETGAHALESPRSVWEVMHPRSGSALGSTRRCRAYPEVLTD
jgi:hypothetical protein